MFVYSPTDLDPDYLSKYLDDAIAHNKSTWRQHFYDSGGKQHEDCPDAAWETWRGHWDSEEGRQKSKAMQEKRALAIAPSARIPSESDDGFPATNSSLSGPEHTPPS